MANGAVLDEQEIIGGWRDFPMKSDVAKIELQGRVISPASVFGTPQSDFAGFAVHWVGEMRLGGEVNAHARREIMLVHWDKTVDVFSFDPMNLTWEDFADNLFQPIHPHLMNYQLEQHGIRI